jgi:hypothetical protein
MNTAEIYPPTPADVADWSDCESCQQRMIEAVTDLAALAPEAGLARQILEFSSDRRKQALARAMAAPLAGGESSAKAEMQARNDPAYAAELNQLGKQHTAAEQTMTRWEALKVKWECARSLLSMQKESVRRL